MSLTIEILTLCLDKTRRKEIAKKFKWTGGATGSFLKRLEQKKLIEKTRYGIYKTTEKGVEYIKNEIKKLEYDDLNGKIIDIAVLFSMIVDESKGIIKKPEKMHPLNNKYKLSTEIFNIYFRSIKNFHNDLEFARSMWEIHDKMTCVEHEFNFEKAFEKYGDLIKTIDKELVFNTIRINTFSTSKNIKYQLTTNEITTKHYDIEQTLETLEKIKKSSFITYTK